VSNQKFRFDGWVFNPESGDLERAGMRSRLQEQPALVLRELIAHAGDVVAREHLIGLLWPNGVVDFDTGLRTAVHKLRNALGDTADTPRYIETLPRRGYRFIASLDPDSREGSKSFRDPGEERTTAQPQPDSLVSASDASSSISAQPFDTAPSPTVPPPPGHRRRWQYAALTAAALTLIAFAVSQRWRPSDTPAKLISDQSIAVLPFADMSETKDQEYFSDGLAEELTDLLAKTPELHVIARTSSFSFKGKSDDIPAIARKLRVANILEGSVRKSGSRLRVSTQLVRAEDGEHLWSETYDRSVTDVFEIQDEIATAVVQALRLKLLLGASEPAKAADGQTANPEAHNLYLLGRHLLRGNTLDSYRRAATAFRNAAGVDPGYPHAYAGLAEAELDVAVFSDYSAGFHLAREAAEKAVTLAPARAEGYAARAIVRSAADLDYAGARADFDRALALDPSDTNSLTWYGRTLQAVGDLETATAAFRKAAELDPLNSEALQRLAYLLAFRHDYAGARHYINRALEVDPNGTFVHLGLAALEIATGRPREALAAAQKIGIDDLRLMVQANAEHSLGDESASDRDLRSLEAHSANVSAYQIAEIHAWRGDRDGAFAWLERAYRQRDSGYEIFKTDIFLEGLRTDSRYKALVREANLPE
jgi:TolB-like protein/DNA-binding winged helix-turn-helix (wHTH) protein/Tfp pilus assembly protein PilF